MNQENMQAYGATLLRVALGVMFIMHAHLKYYTFTLPGTEQFFMSLGLPDWMAYATFGSELIGGLMLVFGIYGRFVALLMMPVVIGATWAHFPNGWVFNAANGGFEYPLFLTVASLVSFLIGDGIFTVKRSPKI